MDYDGLSEKEIHYIDEARIIGRTEGNSKRLSDLCHKAYADYATGAISEMAYKKIYAVCVDYAYPRQILKTASDLMVKRYSLQLKRYYDHQIIFISNSKDYIFDTNSAI